MSEVRNMTVDFDLRQKHVRVSRTTVVEQFLADIRILAIAKAQADHPGQDVYIDNGPGGLDIHWHDITMTLKEFKITDASEESSHSLIEGRKQRNWAKGYAIFEVTVHVSGGPKVTDPNSGKPDWATLFNSFATAYSEMVDGKQDLDLMLHYGQPSVRMLARL